MESQTQKATGRKRAQRIMCTEECGLCGGTETLQRHHINGKCLDNSEENLIVLCQPCHSKIHILSDTWGRKKVQPASCVICGEMFQPARAKRSILCGDPACLSENGKRAAAKRWSKE